MASEFTKPPGDKRPIIYDWTSWLAGYNNDVIVSSALSFAAIGSTDTALVINSPAASFTPTTATVWVSAGTSGMNYYIYNQITTASGIIRTKVVKMIIKTETP